MRLASPIGASLLFFSSFTAADVPPAPLPETYLARLAAAHIPAEAAAVVVRPLDGRSRGARTRSSR
jgi:hypothetical protein